MEATAKEIEQNREAMFARMDREQQEAIADGRMCPFCHSPNRAARWFYRKNGGAELVRCENYDFHTKSKARKRPMQRHEWYTVFILLLLANAAMFDGGRVGGMTLMLIAVLIVVFVDGFGFEL
jgi:hypothetical protein